MYGGRFPPLGRDHVEPPPLSFDDESGRRIEIRVHGDGPVPDETEALVDLYLDFDPQYRSLGIPPTREDDVREWLDVVLADHCVVAWHGDRAVGQAVLVESDGDEYELAVFVHQDYHGAGIGTRLVEALLAYGRERGVRHVWLLVERDNRLAVALYRDVGFVVTDDLGYDQEMGLDVAPPRRASSAGRGV